MIVKNLFIDFLLKTNYLFINKKLKKINFKYGKKYFRYRA